MLLLTNSHRWLRGLLLAGVVGGAALGAEEVVATADGRQVALAVPEGLRLQVADRNGVTMAEISNPSRSVSLQLQFLPDSPASFGTSDKQKAMIAEYTRDDVEQSVEQKLNFKNLHPRGGEGLYFVLTDGNLLDRDPPAGQFLKLTRGIRVSSGLVVFFTLYSQSETSADYRAALNLVRDGIEER